MHLATSASPAPDGLAHPEIPEQPHQTAETTATLVLRSNGPDDLRMDVIYEGAAPDIDHTSLAHNLINHFAHQLLAGVELAKQQQANAEKPELLLVEGGRVISNHSKEIH